ncbi:MAG: hypothetical protein AAGC97_10550 [Planctomycetota bacterium]
MSTFDPFHRGIVDANGTVPLRFPDYPSEYELRLGADAVERRVLLTLEMRLPILAPGFWFCISCLMVDDFVALIAPSEGGVYYLNPDTPQHVPDFDTDPKTDIGFHMTRLSTASDLAARFVTPKTG